MCTYSNVSDHALDKWWHQPPAVPMPGINAPWPYQGIPAPLHPDSPTKQQFQELIDLLKKAAEIDAFTGAPDCGLEEKKVKLREIAVTLGLDPSVVP